MVSCEILLLKCILMKINILIIVRINILIIITNINKSFMYRFNYYVLMTLNSIYIFKFRDFKKSKYKFNHSLLLTS